MAFPDYVPTRVVTVGGAMVLESSELLRVAVTITASRSLVWDATGYRFEKLAVTAVSEPGSEVQFGIPRTDVQGWKDSATNQLIDVSVPGSFTHKYTALVRFLTADGRTTAIKDVMLGPFVLPDGDAPLDLDKTVPTSTISGETVSIPDRWSQDIAEALALVQANEVSAAAAQEASEEAGLARDGAQQAAAVATARAADVQAVVATNDGIMTAVQSDSGSTFAAQQQTVIGAAVDVIRPDGNRRAVGKGEILLSVLDYGAKGDSNSTGSTGTDDASAIQAAATAALSLGRTLWFPKVTNGYRSTATVDLPGGIDVRMDSPVISTGSGIGIRYNGTGAVVNSRDLVLRQKRGVVTDWLSESDIGIQTRNVQRSRIVIAEASNNTIGYQRLGDVAGHVYNEITLLLISNNKIGVDCETTTSTGWVNEENLYGGNFTVGSTTNTDKTRIGVRIRSTPGYLNNAQVYHKPAFEIAVGLTGGAEAIPILIADGVSNKFHDVRNEGTSLLVRTTGNANNNYVSVTYGSAGATGDSVDDQGQYPTTVVERSRFQHLEAYPRTVWEMPNIHKRAFPYNATDTNVPGMLMVASGGTALFRSLSGFTINTDYLEVSNRHLGIQIRTTDVKRFVVSADCEPGYGGRFHIRCYDATGTIMDPASYTATPLVRGASGRPFSAAAGMGYQTGSDSNAPAFFAVSASVASIVLCASSGSAALRIRSLRVASLSPNAQAAYTPFPENMNDPVATQAPTVGTHTVGRRVFHGAPAVGQPQGWVCTASGTPGTWAPMPNL